MRMSRSRAQTEYRRSQEAKSNAITYEAETFISLFYAQLRLIRHFLRLAGLNEKYLKLRLITHTTDPFSFFFDEFLEMEDEANDILVLIHEVRALIKLGRDYKKTMADTEERIDAFLQKYFSRVIH